MTISLKKVTAGSGYDYLIRQVAAQDSTVKAGLAAYYEEKGEAPGVWMGSGLVWETVTPPPRRQPQEQHLPSFGHDRNRGGPSIGF